MKFHEKKFWTDTKIQEFKPVLNEYGVLFCVFFVEVTYCSKFLQKWYDMKNDFMHFWSHTFENKREKHTIFIQNRLKFLYFDVCPKLFLMQLHFDFLDYFNQFY